MKHSQLSFSNQNKVKSKKTKVFLRKPFLSYDLPLNTKSGLSIDFMALKSIFTVPDSYPTQLENSPAANFVPILGGPNKAGCFKV